MFFIRLFFAFIFGLSGIYHFKNPDFYMPLMPDFLPAHKSLIYLSGVVEILVAVGLFWPNPQVQRLAVWGTIGLLLVFTPVHLIDYMQDRPYVGSKTIAAIRLLVQAIMLAVSVFLL